MVLLCGVVAALAIGADVLRSDASSSHVGQFVGSVRAGGWSVAAQVALRKWAMNWRLVRNSAWTVVVLAALAVFGVTAFVRRPRWWRDQGDRVWLTRASVASLFGAAASWAFNDCGIVAAALTLLYGAGAFAYAELGASFATEDEAPSKLRATDRLTRSGRV